MQVNHTQFQMAGDALDRNDEQTFAFYVDLMIYEAERYLAFRAVADED